MWQIGITAGTDQFGLQEHVAVYVPQSVIPLPGVLYFVKRERVRLLTDISSADAPNLLYLGGVSEIDEDEIDAQ